MCKSFKGTTCKCLSRKLLFWSLISSIWNCLDIDECSSASHLCVTTAACVNTNGSHECECFDNFSLNATHGQCQGMGNSIWKLLNLCDRGHWLQEMTQKSRRMRPLDLSRRIQHGCPSPWSVPFCQISTCNDELIVLSLTYHLFLFLCRLLSCNTHCD